MEILNYVIHIAIIAILTYQLLKHYSEGELTPLLLPSFLMKIAAGILFGLIFKEFYSEINDSDRFHSDLITYKTLFFQDPGLYFKSIFSTELLPAKQFSCYSEPRAMFFLKLISPISIACNGNYWIITAYLSFLNFIAGWILITRIEQYFPKLKFSALLAFLCFPSILFWSSGLMKESIVMAAVYFILSVGLDFRHSHKINGWKWPIIFFSMWVLLILKYYLFAVFIPFLLAYVLTERYLKSWKSSYRILAGLGLILILGIAASFVHPNLYPANILKALMINHDIILTNSPAHSTIDYGVNQFSTSAQILRSFPIAIITALYRPFIFEQQHVLGWIAGIENLVLVLITVGALITVIQKKIRLAPESWYLIAFVIVMSGMLGLSAPNFGTLVRYKVYFLPFFLSLTLYPFQVFLKHTILRK